MPANPQDARGECVRQGNAPSNVFDGTFKPYQTGAPGAGTLAPTTTVSYAWPPPTLRDHPDAGVLPH